MRANEHFNYRVYRISISVSFAWPIENGRPLFSFHFSVEPIWMLSWLAPCVVREHHCIWSVWVWARVRKVSHKETGVLRPFSQTGHCTLQFPPGGWRGNGVGDAFASFSSLGIGVDWCFQLDMRNLNKSRRACKVHRHTNEINPLLRVSSKWAPIARAAPITFHGSHRVHVSD